MPLYKIEREVPGWTDADFQAAGFRGKFCAIWFDDLYWIASYFDAINQRMTCVWEANRQEDIEAHGRAAGLPVGRIFEVVALDPDNLDSPAFDSSGIGLPDRDSFFQSEQASLSAGD
jgi:hypothetical protein